MSDRRTSYRFGDVRLERDTARVFRGNEPLPVEPKAFDVLCFLIDNPGRLVEKQELLDAVWGGSNVTENAMTRVVAQLRKLLGDNAREARYIETVPTKGYRFIADVTTEGVEVEAGLGDGGAKAGRSSRLGLGLVLAGTLAALAILLIVGDASRRVFSGGDRPRAPFVRHVSLALNGPLLQLERRPTMTLSPRGDRLVFVGRHPGTLTVQLFVRDMASNALRPLPGTEGASAPSFSPSGDEVAFLGHDSVLTVPAEGGRPPERWFKREGAWDKHVFLSWLDDETVVLAELLPRKLTLHAIAAREAPRLFAEVELTEDEWLSWVDILPRRRGLLLSTRTGNNPDDFHVRFFDLETGTSRSLVTGHSGHLTSTGHLGYVVDNMLLAVPLDPERIEVTGPPSVIVDGILADARLGVAPLAYSKEGLLAYLAPVLNRDLSLVWSTRSGARTVIDTGSFVFANPVLLPDGEQISFRDMGSQNARALWLLQIASGEKRRVPIEGNPVSFVFRPDGGGVYYSGGPEGVYNLFYVPLTGAREPIRLTESDNRQFPKALSGDGRLLVFEEQNGLGQERDLWALPVGDESGKSVVDIERREASPLVVTSSDEREASMTPDGRFIAYQSNASGRTEIYVQSLKSGKSWQVSTDGGRQPLFTRDASEIIYRNGPLMMSVAVTGREDPEIGLPAVLFDTDFFDPGYRSYDVTPDGEWILGVRADGLEPYESVELVVDWPAKLGAEPNGGNGGDSRPRP